MQGSMKKVSQLKAEVLAGVEQMPPGGLRPSATDAAGPLYVMCSLYDEAYAGPLTGDACELGWPWLP